MDAVPYSMTGARTFRPGQPEPSEFELAILERILEARPAMRARIRDLLVLSRQYSGVGSFTNFRCENPGHGLDEESLPLDALISLPGVPHGMGAVLICKGDRPLCLEVYTFGEDRWDGVFYGFSISGSG